MEYAVIGFVAWVASSVYLYLRFTKHRADMLDLLMATIFGLMMGLVWPVTVVGVVVMFLVKTISTRIKDRK